MFREHVPNSLLKAILRSEVVNQSLQVRQQLLFALLEEGIGWQFPLLDYKGYISLRNNKWDVIREFSSDSAASHNMTKDCVSSPLAVIELRHRTFGLAPVPHRK